jgi:hypothetical protein
MSLFDLRVPRARSSSLGDRFSKTQDRLSENRRRLFEYLFANQGERNSSTWIYKINRIRFASADLRGLTQIMGKEMRLWVPLGSSFPHSSERGKICLRDHEGKRAREYLTRGGEGRRGIPCANPLLILPILYILVEFLFSYSARLQGAKTISYSRTIRECVIASAPSAVMRMSFSRRMPPSSGS